MFRPIARRAWVGLRHHTAPVTVGGDGGSIWKNFSALPDGPAGFTLKTAYDAKSNPTGATTMLEKWEAGTSEPPHGHPGDDMTIVIEGKMKIQFYTKGSDGSLLKDGEPLVLQAGQTGYIASNRIHDVQYVEECQLVYVHSGEFGFHGH
jgi:quercetin dioxygenase-like cupin family protein